MLGILHAALAQPLATFKACLYIGISSRQLFLCQVAAALRPPCGSVAGSVTHHARTLAKHLRVASNLNRSQRADSVFLSCRYLSHFDPLVAAMRWRAAGSPKFLDAAFARGGFLALAGQPSRSQLTLWLASAVQC